MKQRLAVPELQDGTGSHLESGEKEARKVDHDNKRSDARCALAIQAFVAIPSLPSRAYGICEISRGGMFLAFRDARSTKLELEQNDVEPGTAVEVAFSVSLPDGKHRFRVRARIARITAHGIGIQYVTHNPPQLAALREIFSQPGADLIAPDPQIRDADAIKAKQMLTAPPESTCWQDWELVD